MNFLHRSFQIVFFILLFGIVVSILASNNISGMLSILVSLLLVLLLFVKYGISEQFQVNMKQFLNNKRALKISIVVSLFVNLLLLILINIYFQINYVSDPLNVQIKATELIHGNLNWHTNEEYFYFFPNTVFFTVILSKIMQLGIILHIPIQVMLCMFNILLLFGLSIFSLLTIYNLTKKLSNVFWGSLFIMVLPIMYLYPNLVIYTDTLTMFLTTFICFLISKIIITHSKWMDLIYSVMIIAFYAILFLIKANLIVLVPAMLAMVIITLVSHSIYFKKTIIIFVALLLGMGASSIIKQPIETHYGFETSAKKQMALPVTYWINMGLGTDPTANARGAYSLNDDNFARQSKLNNDTKALTDSIKSRIKSLGVTGLYLQILDKSKTLFGDSLFGYGKYQSGFSKAPSLFVRHESRFHILLNIISSVLMILIIIKIIFMVFNDRVFSEILESTRLFIYFIGISSVGLALFHTVVWEVEPRYFLPLIYPLLLINYLLPTPKFEITERINLPNSFSYILCALVIVIVSLSALANNMPSMTSGNTEYEARVSLLKAVPLKRPLIFKLPVMHNSDTLKINLAINPKIKIKTENNQYFLNEGNRYVLHGSFKEGQVVTVNIIPTKENSHFESVWLYKQPIIYKKIFHGSKIEINHEDYYLPYELDRVN